MIQYSSWAREALAMLAKDLRSELRTKYALNAIVMFAVALVSVLATLDEWSAATAVLLRAVQSVQSACGIRTAVRHSAVTARLEPGPRMNS